MSKSQAQSVRLIVDSSAFEMLSVRDPFTPQVPQEDASAGRQELPKIEQAVTPPPPRPEPLNMPRLKEIMPVIPEKPLPSLTIAGVVWNTDNPQAIINGQIISVGDIISDVKILNIQRSGVTVLFQGRTETIEFGQ